MSIKHHIGTQFYKYEDGMTEPIILRLTKYKDVAGGIFTFNNIRTNERIKMDNKDFADAAYTKLKPNALITFNLVKVNKTLTDVMVCMHRDNDGSIPYAVCRQSISDIFANTVDPNSGKHYVGLSVSQDTCPTNLEFKNVLSCDSIESTLPIAVYLKDRLTDILALVNVHKYDDVLRAMNANCEGYQPTPRHDRMTGYCKSLEELLANNKFMYDVRCGLGIIECPFHILDTDTELKNVDMDFLEEKLNNKIAKTYVIPYEETLNLHEFVRSFALICTITDNKIYVVGYDEEEDNR